MKWLAIFTFGMAVGGILVDLAGEYGRHEHESEIQAQLLVPSEPEDAVCETDVRGSTPETCTLVSVQNT
jgi:hypothetical protein